MIAIKITPDKRPRGENPMFWPVSFVNYVHGWAGLIGSVYVLLTDLTVWQDPFFARSTPTQFIASVCAGYLVVDYLLLTSSGLIKTMKEYAFLHAVVLVAYLSYLWFRSGAMLVLVGLFGELPALFLHHSRFMFDARIMMSWPRLYVGHEMVRAASFPLARLIPIGALLLQCWGQFREAWLREWQHSGLWWIIIAGDETTTGTGNNRRFREREVALQATLASLVFLLNVRYTFTHAMEARRVLLGYRTWVWRQQEEEQHSAELHAEENRPRLSARQRQEKRLKEQLKRAKMAAEIERSKKSSMGGTSDHKKQL